MACNKCVAFAASRNSGGGGSRGRGGRGGRISEQSLATGVEQASLRVPTIHKIMDCFARFLSQLWITSWPLLFALWRDLVDRTRRTDSTDVARQDSRSCGRGLLVQPFENVLYRLHTHKQYLALQVLVAGMIALCSLLEGLGAPILSSASLLLSEALRPASSCNRSLLASPPECLSKLTFGFGSRQSHAA